MLNFRNRQLIPEPLPHPWHVDCSYNVAQNIPIGDNFKSQYRIRFWKSQFIFIV